MCFFGSGRTTTTPGPTQIIEKPAPIYTPAPVATKAALGEEAGVELAKKERKMKEQSALQGMKIALNVGPTGAGSPGGNVSP